MKFLEGQIIPHLSLRLIQAVVAGPFKARSSVYTISIFPPLHQLQRHWKALPSCNNISRFRLLCFSTSDTAPSVVNPHKAFSAQNHFLYNSRVELRLGSHNHADVECEYSIPSSLHNKVKLNLACSCLAFPFIELPASKRAKLNHDLSLSHRKQLSFRRLAFYFLVIYC